VTPKEPVLLTVLVETESLSWHAAGITLSGAAIPLLRSDTGNLDAYLGRPFDDQVSFLRHRFSGVLQRAGDRLWGRQLKPCQIVFVLDGPFLHAKTALTQAVATHLVEWLTNPPVVFFMHQGPFLAGVDPRLEALAGDIPQDRLRALTAGQPKLAAAIQDESAWELVPKLQSV
jgi:hypothetical protein